MKTYKDRIIAGLIALGWTETVTNSRYRAFQNPSVKTHMFVGKNGALRSGKCASASVSIGCAQFQSTAYKHILQAGEVGPKTKVTLSMPVEAAARIASDPEAYAQGLRDAGLPVVSVNVIPQD